MTNKEYIINILSDDYGDPFDDGGASYEALVYYNISCPYRCGDKRAHCYGKSFDFINREVCVACKMEWLDQEIDK